jgi:protein gp37
MREDIAACDACYAEKLDQRDLRGLGETHWEKEAPRYLASDEYWKKPLAWERKAVKEGIRKRVFSGSMCDVMEHHDDVREARQCLFALIEETPHLDWLLLTKRPQEYRHFLPESWRKEPRHNVWLMTTVENADYVWRIHETLRVPAVVYGVSMERLLSSVQLPAEFLAFGRRAWVIVGGESGRALSVRPSAIQWFREIRDQAVTAHVPFHFKQWGTYNADSVRIGKKASGRLLDGREWNELPVPASV